MNANYPSIMPTINEWLNNSSHKLADVNIPSANLDTELLLASAINQGRTYLHAHPDKIIEPNQFNIANDYLNKRMKRIPIAYIIGHKEFYGREFQVDKSTLIPRPESEDIINVLNNLLINYEKKSETIKLVDIGTGSGCLGITAKLEFPRLDVTLIDNSPAALIIAEKNAKALSANVTIIQSNLLLNYNDKPDIIIANLPYVDKEWERSPETNFEPKTALFAKDNGMELIKKLINQSANVIKHGGYLILESDPCQQSSIIEYAKQYSFNLIETSNYITVFKLLD